MTPDQKLDFNDRTDDLQRLDRTSTPFGRLRQSVNGLMRHPATDAVVTLAILASVGLLFVELELADDHAWFHPVVNVGHVLTGFFIVEMSLRWFAAPSHSRFWREYWLDVIAVISFLRPIRILRILRLLRLYRVGVIAQKYIRGAGEFNFEEKLRDDVQAYQGKFARFVHLTPFLYRLFTNLLDDGRVHNQARRRIVSTLSYYITPYEVLSRKIHGAEGYLDQVYYSLETVSDLREELPDWLLQEAWEGEGDILKILDERSVLQQQLDADATDSIRKYLGISQD